MKGDVVIGLLIVMIGLFGVVMAFSVDFDGNTPVEGSSAVVFNISINTSIVGDSYTFVDFDNDVTHWFTFESFNGTYVYDNSSYENHATYTASASQSDIQAVSNWGDYSYNASATDGGYLTVTNIPTNTYSISFWIKMDSIPAAQYEF